VGVGAVIVSFPSDRLVPTGSARRDGGGRWLPRLRGAGFLVVRPSAS
jgi:hypothetical protein